MTARKVTIEVTCFWDTTQNPRRSIYVTDENYPFDLPLPGDTYNLTPDAYALDGQNERLWDDPIVRKREFVRHYLPEEITGEWILRLKTYSMDLMSELVRRGWKSGTYVLPAIPAY